MKLLFIHPVFAGQFHRQIRYLRANHPDYEISFLSSRDQQSSKKRSLGDTGGLINGIIHHSFNYRTGLKHKGAASVQRFADEIFQGKAVSDACLVMQSKGYRPDVIICHGRWGAGLFVKDVYPDVPLLLYSEFFSTAENARHCMNSAEGLPIETAMFYRLANASNLISLDAADHIITPTQFQKQSHPTEFHDKMSVVFDGVDTETVRPGNVEQLKIGEVNLTSKDEIVTYVTRSFEAFRGFETFIKAMEIVQRQRPKAHILIAGGVGEKGYGAGEVGASYRKRVLDAASLDQSRLHFMGPLNFDTYLNTLRFSQVHVYLTVPFVLSWSLIEAMSTGCAIVGSRTQPVEELISHGANGLLADFYFPDQIAAHVMTLLDDPKLRQRLGHAGRQLIKDDFSIDVVGPRFVSLINDLKR